MKKNSIIMVVLGASVLVFLLFFFFKADAQQKVVLNGQEIALPKGGVHWHPHLTILVDGQNIQLPSDIGAGTGNIVDTHLSGMQMSPTHTHESDGTIHIENNNPLSKPETVTLGYFFEVWGKNFNAQCMFDYCTDTGSLTMMVNGMPNTEFEQYVMHDKDEIVLEYKTR